ncbi:hypothetical protein QBC47DRAFT_361624 [Echria macrotheca]|uniref:Survival Motor Neuron Gemin2-binding domain-containing protein n=1 Tax=Echria macrotheca TaxID=438768 RepID=A0AAJ0F8P2_9PEZI|nr:hypothetical protein QBC47DRAFT_361624 [Echria macrotheca]
MDVEKEQTYEEIWDDSALVDSWNHAVDEYKKYHSIHAIGGAVEDILRAERENPGRNAKPETEGPPPERKSDETGTGIDSESSQDAIKDEAEQAPGIPVMAPQMVLGSVQDEDLKRLLMSWYYAGYYTGLYEGKQKAQQ